MEVGKPVIVPTDTVYGLATMAVSEAAIQRLYKIRGREREPALPFLIVDADEMPGLAQPNNAALQLARRFWPGLLTLILPPAPGLPAFLKATPIAVRMPNFAPLVPLLVAAGGDLIITGALRSGYPPAITVKEAAEFFGESVALILDGGTAPYGIPSTIVDCITKPPSIVRRGAIGDRPIWKALGQKVPESFAEDL